MQEHSFYPEAVRNRLLRRADWRFLLSDPNPASIIYFARGLLVDAVKLVSKNTVDGMDSQAEVDSCCDLAVVADPSLATLRAAWQALRPGGALYGEWNNPLAATSARVTCQLVAAGFSTPACYWPSSAPERETAGAWLPLAAPGALRYYAQSRSAGPGAVRNVVAKSKWLLWQSVASLGVAKPLCAIAYKPIRGVEPATQPEDILQHLCREWQALGFGAPPRQLHWLLLTGGLRSINKAVGLVFADNEDKPRVAVKMARVPESLPALAHEATILRTVQAHHCGEMAGVPQVLFDGQCLGETALTGTPLWRQLRRDNFADFAARATHWQVDLAGDARPVARVEWWDRLVAGRLAWFTATFGAAVEWQQLHRTAEILASLPDLPLVCEQRDFSPWNVLLNGQELIVLDWEGAELQGLPLLDLIYFLTYLALFVENVPVHGEVDVERVRKVYRALFDARSELGTVVQECLSEYIRCVALPAEVLHPLRLLTWMVHAQAEYQAMWAEVGSTPGVTRLRKSVFLHLWEEELAVGGRGV